MSNLLDASALISLIPTVLSPSSKTLQSPQDALAVLSHSILSALAFRLIAIDDDSSGIQSSTNVLPEEWNKNGPGSYTFRYKHEQSSLEFIIKLTKLGSRTIVNAIAAETDKETSLAISTADFTSPSAFPYDTAASESPLVHCYISSNRVTDFVSQFQLKIIQKLVPGLRKDGYTEEVSVETSSSSASRQQQQHQQQNPPPAVPRIPRYNPDEEFPLRIPRNPLEIGRRDLDPIPGGSFQPPSLFPPSSSGDGMFVGPNHPIFGGRSPQGIPGNRGPWGGDGYLPPMGAPPGARFDPVGPGMGPGPGGVGIGRFPDLGPRRPNLPGFGDPDNDEFMPPGAGDMYM
jgi:proteasome inhibitor subunit 1 (PI31)